MYLVNTCTVTGTGDQKSLKTIRRVTGYIPQAAIVVAGALPSGSPRRACCRVVRLVSGVSAGPRSSSCWSGRWPRIPPYAVGHRGRGDLSP